MNAIITVVGSDKVGIIATVSSFLSEHKINIEDITQTILSGNFVMMMMVSFVSADITVELDGAQLFYPEYSESRHIKYLTKPTIRASASL